MNFGRAKHVLWQTTVLLSITYITLADPGEDFLNSIIGRLKQEHTPDNYQLFYDELFRATSRSSNDYQIHETPEPSENSIYQQNNEFDQNQNEIFQQLQQLEQIQNQAGFVAGNYLNPATNDNQKIPQILGLQQFNINGYLHLPPPELPAPGLTAETTETPQPNTYNDNAGPNLFNPANQNQMPVNEGVFDINNPQLFMQNLQNTETTNEAAQNNEPLVPTYYYYNPENSIDDNFIDDTINAMKPLNSESAMDQQPGKKFIVEPLFVAMAGFVGIAMIFMSAVLFLPKILTPPPEVSSLKGPQELAALTKLAVETIEGNDCTERIACEVGRAMRNMQLSSKPIRVLEVLLPDKLAKQLAQIRKAVANKKTCKLIQCKRLKPSELKAKQAEKKLPKIELEMVEQKSKIGEIKLPKLKAKPIKLEDKKLPKLESESLEVKKNKTSENVLPKPDKESSGHKGDKNSAKPERKVAGKKPSPQNTQKTDKNACSNEENNTKTSNS